MLTLSYLPSGPDNNGWKMRHLAAVREPKGPERHIVGALRAWIEYADSHRERFGSGIGQDSLLGPAWARWGAALRELLNGECGRLDCGTLDALICRNLEEQGFDPDQL